MLCRHGMSATGGPTEDLQAILEIMKLKLFFLRGSQKGNPRVYLPFASFVIETASSLKETCECRSKVSAKAV